MGVHETVLGQDMRVLFKRARVLADPEAAVLLDLRVYMVTIDLAVERGWKLSPEARGKELFRQVSRLVLMEWVDPGLWSACRSCRTGPERMRCSACGGTGSLLPKPKAFFALVAGDEALWRERIAVVREMVSRWVDGSDR